jgi:hypothetical protein
MVACLLLQMPWNERHWDDACAGFDRSKRKAVAEGVSADCSKRERRRHHAVLGQAARRETDHATLYLRQGEGRQGVAARETRRGRTEWWSLAPARRLAQAAVGARTRYRVAVKSCFARVSSSARRISSHSAVTVRFRPRDKASDRTLLLRRDSLTSSALFVANRSSAAAAAASCGPAAGGSTPFKLSSAFRPYFERWNGTLVTTMFLRKSSAPLMSSDVWLCSRCCHQRAGTNSGRMTVT